MVSYEEAIIIPVKGSGPVGIATAVIDTINAKLRICGQSEGGRGGVE
jgi:hypothetical protein